jgi:tetratricopeptide (TPR) repeat protein
MSNTEIEKQYASICGYILNKELSKAFPLIENFTKHCKKTENSEKFLRLKETYLLMLQYTFAGVDDPERPSVYRKMQIDLLALADDLRQEMIFENPIFLISSQKKIIENRILRNQAGISKYFETLKELPKEDNSENRKQILSDLFNFIWQTNVITDNDIEILKKNTKTEKLFLHERCLIVSALTLSLLLHFDARKFKALFEFYGNKNPEVRNRALVGLVLAFYVYDRRLHLYKEIKSRIKLLPEDTYFSENIESIILQLIKTRETVKISDKLRNEIMPEMAKFKPKLEDKLDLDRILSDNLIEDKNPDWEEIFEDAPDLLNKMSEYSQMQLEGSDVFMSAFSQLKNFPFFDRISNWFLPFYKENSDMLYAFESEDKSFDPAVFIDGLERSVYMCNSDKYSFCLNIGMMPVGQKKMITELFKIEAESMSEVNESDAKIDARLADRQIITRYIQDLYRFFKLHPVRNEIRDIFEGKLDIYNTYFFKTSVAGTKILRKAAEFLFQKEYYEDSIEAFKLIEIDEKNGAGIYEKIGFSYQRLKKFTQALDFYNKAELYGSKSQWLIKKIAFCYRKVHNFEKALQYYRKTEIEQPENLHIQANIAHCLLSLEKFDEALKYYFKVEYFDPENKLVMRPLAWCLFLTQKSDSAEKYYQKLIATDKNAFDLINYGHVLFTKNDKKSAIEKYLKAKEILGFEKLTDNIKEDSVYLKKAGVSQTDIDLLIDYLSF